MRSLPLSLSLVALFFGACSSDSMRSVGVGVDADVESDAALPTTNCPDGMLLISNGASSFCIASLEASIAKVLLVSDRVPQANMLPSFCPAAKLSESFNNNIDLPLEHPAIFNYCQAATYCVVLGQRLCGKIGGGAVPYGILGDPAYLAAYDATVSEWHYACTKGGTQEFSYGDTHIPDMCIGSDEMSIHRAVGSDPICQGGFDGLFDMLGGAWEWTNSCFDSDGNNPPACRARGGGSASGFPQSRTNGFSCSAGSEVLFDTYLPSNFPEAGARCCADPTP